jgi:predicted GNAT family N-acyltransferase
VQYKEEFSRLNQAWIQKYFKIEPKDIEQLSNPEKIVEQGGQVFFILQDSEVLATCALIKINPGTYELAKMAVAESHLGQSLGNQLMQKALSWAESQKAQKIIIRSNTRLIPALSLYKKFGFKTTRLGPNADYERCDIEMSYDFGDRS